MTMLVTAVKNTHALHLVSSRLALMCRLVGFSCPHIPTLQPRGSVPTSCLSRYKLHCNKPDQGQNNKKKFMIAGKMDVFCHSTKRLYGDTWPRKCISLSFNSYVTDGRTHPPKTCLFRFFPLPYLLYSICLELSQDLEGFLSWF